jgi:hypothetical protein
MKSKILVLGVVLISVFAVAQSSNSAKKSSDNKQTPAVSKVTPEKMEAGSETLKTTTAVPLEKAKPSAADDWQAKQAATGNSNGDGKPDAAGPSSSDVKSPRDLASGQASGKRQHQPVTLKKEDAPTPPSEKK